MFRNPRENAIRNGTDLIKPSVGRPPSPSYPSSTVFASVAPAQAPSFLATMATVVSPRPPPSRSGSTPKSVSTQAQEKGKNNSSKAKVNQNGNIMSFFKKVEQDTLFLEDKPVRQTILQLHSRPDLGDQITAESFENLSSEQQDSPRFNEDYGPCKRRKLSKSDEEAYASIILKPAIYNQPVSEVSKVPEGANAISIPDESPPESVVNKKSRQIGPFVEESDSEDETPFRRKSTAVIHNQENHAVSPINEIEVKIDVEEEEKEEELLNEEHEPMSREFPPSLKREATSYAEGDGFAEFEGLEDFDDEYAEGEEFVERKWMRDQERLDMEEGDFDGDGDDGDFIEDDTADLDGIKKEPEDEDVEMPEPAVAACPICSASFRGVSDQEASVHVNHCLDGNPTPLPTPAATTKPPPIVKAETTIPSARFRRTVRPARPGQENPFTLGSTNGTSSAFSKLMSGHAEDAAWATAAAAEHAARGKPAFQRTCPFYKILPGFYICVDAFRYGAVQGCNAYFLSHFHSDHYIGLTSTWCHGPIYCSRATGNLVRQQLRVDSRWVVDLEFEKKIEVPGTEGVFVTMIPANHCPGSSIYLFEKVIGKGKNPKVQRVLHCGDFRACPAHVEHPLLRPETIDPISGQAVQQRIDVCYLDTTYLNPKYAFPSQEDVIQACADMCVSLNKPMADSNDKYEQMKKERAGTAMANFVRKDSSADTTTTANNPSNTTPTPSTRGPLLVVVGTYSIGKERICLGIARALRTKIYAPPPKQRICACLEDAELNSYLTSDPRAAQVHMTPLFEIRAETLGDYLAEYRDAFSRCVGFRPSGWNYRPPGSRFTESPAVGTVLYSDNWKSNYSVRDLVPQRGSTARAACYGVPYSEHSSFRELSMFCCALRIEKVIPTVNVGSAKGRERMKAWCDRWAVERKKNGLFKVSGKDGRSEWYPGKGTWELRTTL